MRPLCQPIRLVSFHGLNRFCSSIAFMPRHRVLLFIASLRPAPRLFLPEPKRYFVISFCSRSRGGFFPCLFAYLRHSVCWRCPLWHSLKTDPLIRRPIKLRPNCQSSLSRHEPVDPAKVSSSVRGTSADSGSLRFAMPTRPNCARVGGSMPPIE